MQDPNTSHLDLQATAKEIIQRYGFEPDFSAPVAAQLANLDQQPKSSPSRDIRDMRNLLWSSIDNDTSRDLDQIEVAEEAPDGAVRVLVAIADVDAFVPMDSP